MLKDIMGKEDCRGMRVLRIGLTLYNVKIGEG